MPRAAPLAVAMMFALPYAHAGAGWVLPPGVDCSKSDAADYDYNCPPLWFEEADAQLNVLYKRLLQSLQANEAQKLRESQRAWLEFRDADTKLVVEHYGEGGSLGRSVAAMRAFQLTRDRIKDFQARLADRGRW